MEIERRHLCRPELVVRQVQPAERAARPAEPLEQIWQRRLGAAEAAFEVGVGSRGYRRAPVFDWKALVFVWQAPLFHSKVPVFDGEAPVFDR